MEHPRDRVPLLIAGLLVTLLIAGNMLALGYRFLVFESANMRHGSTMALHSVVPLKKHGPRVVMLGNSVFQYTKVVDEVRKRRRVGDGEVEFEVVNFGYVGASIADYLFAYQHLRTFEPDLLVVHLTPHTFDHHEPLVRTDLKHALLLPEFIWLMDVPEIRKAYTRDELVESLVHSYLPVYRFVPLMKEALQRRINEAAGARIMAYYPWRLNIADEWRITHRRRDSERARRFRERSFKQYDESSAISALLMDQLQADATPTLFVVQERNLQWFARLPIEAEIAGRCAGEPWCSFVDFQRFYREAEFSDPIHPNPAGAAAAASRLVPAIRRELARSRGDAR